MKIIAIGGEPATGKTTLMFKLISMTDDWKVCKPEKLLDAMYSEKLNLYILGKYENDGNVFQGTDRLSMAVQPDAAAFIDKNKNNNVNMIFEGDRLFNSKYIDHIQNATEDFRVLVLTANKDVVGQRHVDREDDQDDKFINGRRTKVSNIMNSLTLLGYIDVMPNESFDDQKKIIDYIRNYFNWSE